MWNRKMKSAMGFTRNSNRNCSIVKSEMSLHTPILVIILLLLISSQAYSAKGTFLKEIPFETTSQLYNRMIIDSKDNIYLATKQNLFKSINGAASWKKINFDKSKLFINDICALAHDKFDNIYIADAFGLYFLKVGEDTARYSRSYNYASDIFVTDDDVVVVKNQLGSVLVSKDYSKTWQEIFLTKENFPYLPAQYSDYDKSLGIIDVLRDAYPDSTSIYHTTDFGKIWQRLQYLPGTNIELKYLFIINDSLWLINLCKNNAWKIYDLTNKKTYDINSFDYTPWLDRFEFYTFGKKVFICSYASDYGCKVYTFAYDSAPMEIINKKIFPEHKSNWMNTFAVDNKGILYATTGRKGLIKKSNDQGETWQNITIDLPFADIQETKIKYKNGCILTADHWSYLYYSSDQGENWIKIPQPPNKDYIYDFDINKNNEIIISNGLVHYTSDFGKNWKLLDTNYFGQNVCIQDDGSIFGWTGGHLKYLKSQKDTCAYIIGGISKVTKLSDGRLFGIYNGQPAKSNSDWSEFYPLKGFPKINDYLITKNEQLYCASEQGLYKAKTLNDKGNLVGFNNISVSNICEDANGYIYVLNNQDNTIYRTTDDCISWQPICTNLPFSTIYSFNAFGDQKIIVKTDKFYIGQIKDEKILQLYLNSENDILYYKDSLLISFNVKDNYGSYEPNAKIIIFNSVLNNYDTVVTDNYGFADYTLKSEFYTPDMEFFYPIYIWAESETAYSSRIYIHGYLYNKSIKRQQWIEHKEGSHYYYCMKGDNPVYSMDMKNEANQSLSGKFIIENSLTGTKDIINFDVINPLYYQFDIPESTKYGMYSLIFTGVYDKNNDTAYYETYVIYTDRPYIDWDTAATDPPKYAVYPNPVKDFVTISNFWGKAQIFDIFGREVWSGLVEEKMTINTASFSRGLYILKTVNSQIDQTIVTKIMKE